LKHFSHPQASLRDSFGQLNRILQHILQHTAYCTASFK